MLVTVSQIFQHIQGQLFGTQQAFPLEVFTERELMIKVNTSSQNRWLCRCRFVSFMSLNKLRKAVILPLLYSCYLSASIAIVDLNCGPVLQLGHSAIPLIKNMFLIAESYLKVISLLYGYHLTIFIPQTRLNRLISTPNEQEPETKTRCFPVFNLGCIQVRSLTNACCTSQLMFPNNVSRKGEIFNYSICGPKCPIPFHISLQWLKGKKREGSAPLQGQVITKERKKRLVGALVVFLPEPLFANVTYSLSEIIKCKTLWYSAFVLVLFFFLNLLIMLLLLFSPRLINLIFKQK